MKGLSAQEAKDLIVSVGTHREERRLSPLEVAQLIRKSLNTGTTRSECAEGLGIGNTQLSTFLRLLELSPKIQHLAEWGRSGNVGIAFSSLAELARIPANDQVYAAEAILKHDLAWKEVIELVQLATRSSKSIQSTVKAVLKRRPAIETRHLFVGAITSEDVRSNLAAMNQAKRDEMFNELLLTSLVADEGVSGRLGVNRFAIMGDVNLAKTLNLSPDEFERALNKMLAERLGVQ